LCVQALGILTSFKIVYQKPLTVYFLRKAHELYKVSPEKELSPSFWDAEGVEMQALPRFDGILPGLEHALGTLIYV
jgi:trafficking protein particle complex subunit 8